MKTKIKKVEEEILVYIANDGTEFYREWDCIEYESKKTAEKYKQFILDEDGEEVLPENSVFIKVINKKMHKDLNAYFEANNYVCSIPETKKYPSIFITDRSNVFKNINFLKTFFE